MTVILDEEAESLRRRALGEPEGGPYIHTIRPAEPLPESIRWESQVTTFHLLDERTISPVTSWADAEEVGHDVPIVTTDQCWRCLVADVPREDDVGLCESCKTALRDLTAPVPYPMHSGGPVPSHLGQRMSPPHVCPSEPAYPVRGDTTIATAETVLRGHMVISDPQRFSESVTRFGGFPLSPGDSLEVWGALDQVISYRHPETAEPVEVLGCSLVADDTQRLELVVRAVDGGPEWILPLPFPPQIRVTDVPA